MKYLALLVLFCGLAFGIGFSGTAGMNGGSGTITGANRHSNVLFTTQQSNGYYTIQYDFGTGKPYAIQLQYASTITLGLNASITSTCSGTNGQIQVIRFQDNSYTTIGYWPSSAGSMVSLIISDTGDAAAIYTVRVTTIGSSSCTVTVNNVVFGFIQGPYPGPSQTSADLIGGSGTVMPSQNGPVGRYTSSSAEGSLSIVNFFNVPIGIETEVTGLAFVWLNGSISTTCNSYGGSYGSINIQKCDQTIIASYYTIDPRVTNFYLSVVDSVVPLGYNCYFAAVYSVGASTCATTVSNLNLGADQILINL